MNGFFIVIEISGLQPLLSIENSAGTELIKNCERSINNTIRTELHINGSFLIFQIESRRENSAAIVESAESILEIVSSYSEEIHEYSMMLLYRNNTDAGKLAVELKQGYFSKCEDCALLIENRIFSEAGRLTDGKILSGYQIIKLEDNLIANNSSQIHEKLIKQHETERLVKLIIPEIGTTEKSRRIILSGSSEFVIMLNLEQAIRTASDRSDDDSIIYIDFLENETDVIMPFFRSVDITLIPIIEEYLEGVELKSWNIGRYKLEQNNSDYPAEYFFSIYSLYLKGVLKSLEQALLPQVIVLTGINNNSGIYIEYASRIIDYLENDCSPILFFIDNASRGEKYNYNSDNFFSSALKMDCCARIESPEGIKRLNYLQTRLLYILNLTMGLFSRNTLKTFLTGFGYNSTEILAGIKALSDEGCIIDKRYLRVIQSAELEEVLGKIKDKPEIYKALAGFISKNIHKQIFNDYGLAAYMLADFADDEQAAIAIYYSLTMMLDFGRTEFVIEYLKNCDKLKKDIAASLEMRSLLIKNNKAGCLTILDIISEKPESPEDLNSALLFLEASRYFHALNEHQRALNYIKKVLIFLQAGDYPGLEGAAFIELGFLMLCKGKLLESSEYLNLAIEKLAGSGEVFNLMKAYIFSGIQQYLWGALDDALASTEKALEIARTNGFEEWRFFTDFLICRLYFELGSYYDAEKILSDCLLRSEIFPDEQRRKIFSAWTARACVYQGKIYRGINMLLSLEEDPEVLFFLAEAYYFNGNMEMAVDSIERAGSNDEYFDLGFLSLENISWKNGFNSVEGRVLRSKKGTGVLLHNIRAFHAFMLGMTGNREYGIEILFSLTRDERISENDPYNRLYFHFYCQLLESKVNVDVVDKLTLMSKALKYLQQTSSRISSPTIRQKFMTKNYWNSRLVNEARREKLI